MPPAADLLTAIDAFMAARKAVVGVDMPLKWQDGFSVYERAVKLPLEIEGELRGAQLMVVCFPRQAQLKFRLSILFGGAICRLDYTDETHPNAFADPLERLPPIVRGPHYHSWPANRRFFRGVTVPPRLRNALPFEMHRNARSFDAVLRWFCSDTKINQPPANHRIELPGTDVFL